MASRSNGNARLRAPRGSDGVWRYRFRHGYAPRFRSLLALSTILATLRRNSQNYNRCPRLLSSTNFYRCLSSVGFEHSRLQTFQDSESLLCYRPENLRGEGDLKDGLNRFYSLTRGHRTALLATLTRGGGSTDNSAEIQVEIRSPRGSKLSNFRNINASVLIHAPPCVVYKLLTDYDNLDKVGFRSLKKTFI